MSGWLLNSRSVSNPDSAGHRVSTTAAGPSIAVFVFGTSGPCLCTPLRLWGRSISSVCLSSASSALPPTGATVAPPSHHRDSLLREVALSAQDGIPKVSLRLRAPAEQSCSFPPSTTCPMLLWVCASVPSPTALRVYLGTVQFAYEFSEVKERETVFWDCGFAPPGFFQECFKGYAVGTDRLSYPSICSKLSRETGG